MNRCCLFLFALISLLIAQSAQAQYELKAGNFNNVFVPQTASGTAATPSGPPTVANPVPTDRQFSAMGQVAGAVGPILKTPPAPYLERYPTNGTLVLAQATIGGVFASGVPRYSLGDEIIPPSTEADGFTIAGAGYWRVQPVQAGEVFQIAGSPNIPMPLVEVVVSISSNNSTNVTVASPVPATLVVGSTILGQPITRISGNNVTLAGNANASITSATSVPITPATSFYYSPHAEKVFASQAGRVTITWVSRTPVNGNYFTKTEDFAVSSTTKRPVRTIYWTEGAFDGPTVLVTDNRITTVNPAYYPLVPKAVAQEVSIPGNNPLTPNLTTLSFDKFGGVGQLHAYNVEGRIFIEYLGNVRAAGSIYEFIGSDIVEMVRVPEPTYSTVHLGKEITPHEPSVTISAPPGAGTTAQATATVVNGVVTAVSLIDGGSGYGITPPTVSFAIPDSGIKATASATVANGMVTAVTLNDGGSGYPTLTPSPVRSTLQNAASYYGTGVRSDNSSAYFAERDTSAANNPDNGTPASQDAYNKVVFYWLEEGDFSIKWPKFQDRYWLRWSPNLSDYAHYTVGPTGSDSATGMTFTGGSLPTVVYQDDPAQKEAAIDNASQRLLVTFGPNSDKHNRSLLKFSGSGSVWYVNLYTQTENRQSLLSSTSSTTNGVTTVTVSSTSGLEVGMVVTGPGINGSTVVVRIIDATRLVISQNIGNATNPLAYTVESDLDTPVNAAAVVGTRLPPPAGHEYAGYISGGTGYYPAGYLNPFVVGLPAANRGAIIPVNAIPGNDLTVRWFKKIPAPSAAFRDLYVPGKIGRYTVSYPGMTTPQIVIAQGVGTGDLSGAEAAGSVYYQNDRSQVGYNPNEEHAFPLAPRAYALREDLNVTSGSDYTSEPFVLMAYTDAVDKRPAIHAYKVVRTSNDYDFDYSATAGTLLVKPYPLPLLPEPMVGVGTARTSKDLEIVGADDPTNGSVITDIAYKSYTFKDRKGFTWVHRGPHSTGSPVLSMKLYYLSRPGFFLPGSGEPAAGTVLPFLRHISRRGTPLNINAIDSKADGTPGGIDEPLTVTYRPAWPTDAPELRVGETLTLPKFGLPQVRGQLSAQVVYQQSLANAPTATGLTNNSVSLHDPTREKTVDISAGGIGLSSVPAAIRTTSYRGKTYFQGLPPHLQQRVYLDPLRGSKGTLVFIGTFHDEIAGEDYLDLNLLSQTDENLLKDLVPEGATDKSKWDAAIDALNTRVETFKPDPARFGSHIVDPVKNADVGENGLAVISSPNTAVDSYAITATGKGTGFVTMVFGDGGNPDQQPQGDPVQVKVFRVADQLYVGDLKVLQSSNPLDEKVTLRHSGDFAGNPEDYEFDWRWTTGAASAPTTYATTITKRIGDPTASTHTWDVVRDPGALLPTETQYANAGASLPFPRTENVRLVKFVLDAQKQPTATVIDAESYTDAEINQGFPSIVLRSNAGVDFSDGVPGSIIFSASMGTFDGFVLYVNKKAVLAHKAPTPQFTLTSSSTGLTEAGLLKQFHVAPSYFTEGQNTIEVAIYTTADPNSQSSLNFMLEAAQEADVVTSGGVWQESSDPAGINTNTAVVGGSPTLPFGGPQFVLNDRWFTMRYRPKVNTGNILAPGDTQSEVGWSRWMEARNVEGWVKRVLAAINPFEQRMKDLYNNQVDTDVSVITQAGKRWEGDIALTMDNISSTGLIEIYETVLNRAKDMSIDANTNDADSNNALTLAAGYLNDLYTLLGNEAYADAANPTISIDDQNSVSEVNTSRFAFEAQVSSSLEEELALLRGRTDSVSPGVKTSPAYNRLYWNYTRGINSGEVIYAINYNIKEKVGSSTANGIIDESDAQRMFPQGHGDAYGHYLTALTGYYRLLSNSNFTWTPRAEAVTVLGQPVTVDYMDERKFAAAAGNVARTAQQICSLVYRQNYKDDPSGGWTNYRDLKSANVQTGVKGHQGLDEWVSRSSQGALYHWAVANALVPDVDLTNSGVQKIDRSTVPELAQLATAAAVFQTTIDNANAHLNPLGLSPGAIAFDLSPSEMQAGKSHYKQISGRALQALVNASGAFNQAGRMTRSLRDQQNQIDDYSTVIAQQETAYVNQLIDIYGKPYSGDVGPGRLYSQAYVGPDLNHWFIVDRPTEAIDTANAFTIYTTEATDIATFTNASIKDIIEGDRMPESATRDIEVTVQPSQWVQYNDVWKAGGLGSRPETGELQDALQDAQRTFLELSDLNAHWGKDTAELSHANKVFRDLVATQAEARSKTSTSNSDVLELERVALGLEITAATLDFIASFHDDTADSIAEFFPRVVGLASDVTSGPRGGAKLTGAVLANIAKGLAVASRSGAGITKIAVQSEEMSLQRSLDALGFSLNEVQLAYEYDNLYRSSITGANELMLLTVAHQRALQRVSNVLAKGNRVLAEREVFRQRAAAIIQGYRTKDLGFRIFRNEALEQYRSLFDLASRYSYLSAKSYDYETGLLGTPKGREIFDRIISSRSLGDLTGGVPQSTVSTLGDAGLAGTMAQLNADFSVAEGRLGINNPDQYGTVFSLRTELYRLLNDPAITSDDDAWQQTIEQRIVADVMTDPDVAAHCRNIKKPDGTRVPGIIIPFSTTIQHGKNFFGLDLAAGDHAYTPSNFATKIHRVGIALPGYVGMDAYAAGNPTGAPASGANNALSATPYVYLIPCGNDYMLAPPLGDTNTLRSWTVADQALPLPYNLGANAFNSTQFFNANGTLSEQPWIIRKHQAFRMVSDPTLFYSWVPAEFTNSRLIGRSVWNGQWKIVIPAYTLSSNEQDGLNRFAASVKDLQLFLRTYSNSGN